jgi:tetratricopeptide (TPR) repeat protein
MTPRSALDQARAALARGDRAACAQAALAHAQAQPNSAEAHLLAGVALGELGQLSRALPALAQAVALEPDSAATRAQYARVLILARREAEARAQADAATAHAANEDALTLDTIGCVYARLGDHAAALPLFERAVRLAPGSPDFHFNLATTYGFFGRTPDAEAQYEAMLTVEPTSGRAHFGLAGARKHTAATAHVQRLEEVLDQARDPLDRLRIHYAAAKEYQDLGDADAAFRHLATGNRAHKQRLGFSIETDRANVAAIIDGFGRSDYFAGSSTVADAPIFVLGLPRTGTTLVDRILSSHPAVTSAGELQAMPLAIKRLAGTPSRLILDSETVAAAGRLSPQAVGEAYIDRARQHAGGQSAMFIDKLPLNFLYIGYIARALPNARIICLRRNPMDSIWSNFKNLFATGSAYYAYSYDLEDTARFYLLFDQMMSTWRSLFPGRVLEFSYEGLVADQEGQTRRLLDHCGLPWDAACLNFQDNAAPVATPSAPQVRRGLYKDAVAQWRAYEHHLAPARAIMEAAGIAIEA